MPVHVTLPLFSHPGQELGEGSPVTGKQLRDLAAELGERLQKASATLDQLGAAGWTSRMAVYDVMLAHPRVQTQEDAVRQLRELGLDPEAFIIVEDVDEDLA